MSRLPWIALSMGALFAASGVAHAGATVSNNQKETRKGANYYAGNAALDGPVPLLRGCAAAYLDLGTNRGLKIEELLEARAGGFLLWQRRTALDALAPSRPIRCADSC